jgi:preprotein translocase subunit SecG
MIFNDNPIFLYWFALILAMATIASGASSVYVLQGFMLIKEYKLKRKDIINTFLFALIIIIVVAYIQLGINGMYRVNRILKDFDILFKAGYENIPAFISIVTIVLTIPFFMTIFFISIILQKSEKANELKEYTSINKILTSSLQTLAVIIIFSVLTSSSLRQSIKSHIDSNYLDVFPKEFSYIYGLLFSLFLAIVFIPVYIQSQQKAMFLMEKYEKDASTKDLVDKLKKDSSIVDNIKLILTVISPLITSLLPESLHIFK